MKHFLIVIAIIFFCSFSNCKPPQMSVAEIYLNEAIDFIQLNSIKKDSINWLDFRKKSIIQVQKC